MGGAGRRRAGGPGDGLFVHPGGRGHAGRLARALQQHLVGLGVPRQRRHRLCLRPEPAAAESAVRRDTIPVSLRSRFRQRPADRRRLGHPGRLDLAELGDDGARAQRLDPLGPASDRWHRRRGDRGHVDPAGWWARVPPLLRRCRAAWLDHRADPHSANLRPPAGGRPRPARQHPVVQPDPFLLPPAAVVRLRRRDRDGGLAAADPPLAAHALLRLGSDADNHPAVMATVGAQERSRRLHRRGSPGRPAAAVPHSQPRRHRPRRRLLGAAVSSARLDWFFHGHARRGGAALVDGSPR